MRGAQIGQDVVDELVPMIAEALAPHGVSRPSGGGG